MAQTLSQTLRPTLWRTCRVLANMLRLQILQYLFEHPDQPVSAVAQQMNMPLDVTSRYLRALNARGLLQVYRQGKWVYYRPCADKSVPGAASLLMALRRTFAIESEPTKVVYRTATAFTHPRRLEIVKAIGAGKLNKASLRRKTGISSRASSRHLSKLADRGFVTVDDTGGYHLALPQGALAKALLRLALRD